MRRLAKRNMFYDVDGEVVHLETVRFPVEARDEYQCPQAQANLYTTALESLTLPIDTCEHNKLPEVDFCQECYEETLDVFRNLKHNPGITK